MSIATQISEHRTTTAAEQEAADLSAYRSVLVKDHRSSKDVAALNDAMSRIRIGPAEAQDDKDALDLNIALRASVANAAARWREIEGQIGALYIDQLRSRDPAEHETASKKQKELEQELVDLAGEMGDAAATIAQLRAEHPRVSALIEPIAAGAIPSSVLKSSPQIWVALAAYVLAFGDANLQAKFLRFRGVKCKLTGTFLYWSDPILGPVPLHIAFKKQVDRDIAPGKELLGLLAAESSFH